MQKKKQTVYFTENIIFVLTTYNFFLFSLFLNYIDLTVHICDDDALNSSCCSFLNCI